MHFKKNSHIISISFLYPILILFVISCNSNSKNKLNSERLPAIDTIIDKAGKISFLGGEPALKFIDSATYNKKFSTKEKIRLFGYLSYLYSKYLHNIEKSALYSDSMFYLLNNKNIDDYSYEYSYSYFTRGDVLFDQRKFGEAYSYYYKGKQVGVAFYDSATLGEYSYRLGHVLYLQGKFNEAKLSFMQALELWKTATLTFGKYYATQEIISNIGLCYYKANQPDSSLFYFKKALNYIDNAEQNYINRKELHNAAKEVIFGNIGKVYEKTKQYDSALTYYKKGVIINLADGYEIEDALINNIHVAQVYGIQHKYDSMKNTLLQTEKWLKKSSEYKLANLMWHKQMWQYYDKTNQTQQAYTYLTKYTELFTQHSKETISINSINIDQQVEFLESKKAIEVMQKESKIKEIYLYGSILLVVLMSGFIVVTLIFWNKSKQNIKKLQQLNNTIQHQNFILETQSREKEKILKLVAHDLRTPIASIAALTDMLEEEKEKEPQKELIGIMKMACDSSLKLISEILESSSSTNKEIEKEMVSASDCLSDCISQLQINAAEKKQKFVIKPLPYAVSLYVNKDKMKRVMYNLITNAIKFSHEGGEIHLKMEQHNDKSILISIQDFGIGIPDHIKTNIFNLNDEAKRSGTKGEKSFGLGLTICKDIVAAHNGKIWVESTENKGTTFFVELPLS